MALACNASPNEPDMVLSQALDLMAAEAELLLQLDEVSDDFGAIKTFLWGHAQRARALESFFDEYMTATWSPTEAERSAAAAKRAEAFKVCLRAVPKD